MDGVGMAKYADGVGRRVDHPRLVVAVLGEPEVAVGARRESPQRKIRGVRGMTMMAPVVGLNSKRSGEPMMPR